MMCDIVLLSVSRTLTRKTKVCKEWVVCATVKAAHSVLHLLDLGYLPGSSGTLGFLKESAVALRRCVFP